MGVIAGAAVIGAGASLATGLLASSDKKAAAKKAAREQQRLYELGMVSREAIGQRVGAQAELAQSQLRESEQARFNVLGMLGQPGTYDAPQASGLFSTTPLGLGGINTGLSRGAISEGRSITKSGQVTSKDTGSLGGKGAFAGKVDWKEEGRVIDADALTAATAGTSQFRTISKLTAEAEQLANRTGPMWDELNASVTGGIYAGAAASQRQMMEQVSREMAKGGSARRQGMAIASAMRMQENVNRTRANSLWQAKVNLENVRQSFINNTQALTHDWINNAAGIRDTFTSALTNLQTFWSTVAAPAMMGSQANTQGVLAQSQQQSNQLMVQAIDTKYQAISGSISALTGALQSAGSPAGGSPTTADMSATNNYGAETNAIDFGTR